MKYLEYFAKAYDFILSNKNLPFTPGEWWEGLFSDEVPVKLYQTFKCIKSFCVCFKHDQSRNIQVLTTLTTLRILGIKLILFLYDCLMVKFQGTYICNTVKILFLLVK